MKYFISSPRKVWLERFPGICRICRNPVRECWVSSVGTGGVILVNVGHLPALFVEHAGTSGSEMQPRLEVSILAGAEPRSIVMLMSKRRQQM